MRSHHSSAICGMTEHPHAHILGPSANRSRRRINRITAYAVLAVALAVALLIWG